MQEWTDLLLRTAAMVTVFFTACGSDGGALDTTQIAAQLLFALALYALGTVAGSAFALRTADDGKQAAEHDGRRDAARRARHAAGERAEQPAFRDRRRNALGQRIPEAEQRHGRARARVINQRLVNAEALQYHAEHHERNQNARGGQLCFINEYLADGANQSTHPECVKILHF